MRKTFTIIRSNVAGEVYDTTSAMLSRIENYINMRYMEILRRVNFNAYDYDHSITTVVGQSDYPLPLDFGKCIGAVDTTNSRELSELVSLESNFRNYPSELTTTGNPYNYVILDSSVMVQPSSASVITAVSSSTSDTTQKVLVRGIVSNYETTEQITLNGTTAASTTLQFTSIKGISKDGNTYGAITVTAGSQTLAIMPPKVLLSRYKICRLWYTPNGVYTIKFPYLISPLPLIEDDDYPIIDCEDIIEVGAKADAHSYQRREATANKYESLFESKLANYIWSKENNPNQVKQFQPEPYSRETV